jgi:osmotically-inducible protein OsmY
MPRYPTASLLILLALTACTPRDLVMGGGAALGTASMQERGIRGAVSDYNLRLLINDAWFKSSLDLYSRASLMISNGKIILIGRVPREELRTNAETLAHEATGHTIINRMTVGDDFGFTQSLTDKTTSARLRAALTFDRDVNALNFDIATINGVVYLVGEAQNEREERRVRYLASTIPTVLSVESYIHIPEL